MKNELPHVPRLKYEEIRGHIESGDILLCAGKSSYSRLIKFATKSIWTHVAFILLSHDLDRLMVMESVESRGVQIVPLSSYLNNYLGSGKRYNGDLLIARHSGFHEGITHKISHHAIDMVTCNYSWASIAKITGRLLFNRNSKKCNLPGENQKTYICSEYVYECFRSVGININHSCGYVTPADFAGDERVNAVCLLN